VITEPTLRMLRTVNWEHGTAIVTFHAGEVLRPADQRLVGGFAHVALTNGWAESLEARSHNRASAPAARRTTKRSAA
jgi:hypothetical protein